jgi:hypothetical protein
MTTLAVKGTSPWPVPWRNMLWVTWRQHRAALVSIPAVFGVLAVVMVLEGLHIHDDFTGFLTCGSSSSNDCQALSSRFGATDWHIANGILVAMTLAPALIGACAGVPVLARDLETGTYRYAWTQGIGRERWTIAKLAVIAAVIVAVTEATSEVFTWFFTPYIGRQTLTMQSATVFVTHGIAFPAWSLLAFTIGALAGLLLRQTMPAVAATLAVYTGFAMLTYLVLRPRYPVSGFWTAQLFEAGWLLVLSILLIAATVGLVRRRA